MAKAISKHSRAARRGLVNQNFDEAKDLEKVPKLENDGIKKSIIRTTIKNENLLNKKLENHKVKKNKKKNNAIKHKFERSTKLSGVLSTKIEQSIARAKFVQNSRKAGWDKINSAINIVDLPKHDGLFEKEKEQTEEDEYVKQFFEKDDDSTTKPPQNLNKFSLLEEAEA